MKLGMKFGSWRAVLTGIAIVSLAAYAVQYSEESDAGCCRIRVRVPKVRIPVPKLPDVPVPSVTVNGTGVTVSNAGSVVALAVPGAAVVVVVDGENNSVGRITDDVGRELSRAAQNVGVTAETAAQNTAAEGKRAIRNTGVFLGGLVDYGKAQAEGWSSEISAAERRVREGKVVDAMFSLAVANYKIQDESSADLAMKSSIARTLGAVASGTIGPEGSAAYAAWLTYHQTKDPELALKAGLISGMTSMATSQVSAMDGGFTPDPNVPLQNAGANLQITSQMVKKAALAGAVGGLAVAASGGDESAIKEAFLRSGGMVLIQDAYRQYTTQEMNFEGAKRDALCVAAMPGTGCTLPETAYVRDDNGLLMRVGPDGKFVSSVKLPNGEFGYPEGVDVSKLNYVIDPRKIPYDIDHVGIARSSPTLPGPLGLQEGAGFLSVVAKVPGMNTMALFHDTWAASWQMGLVSTVGTIGPAIVLTYLGSPAGLQNMIQNEVADGAGSPEAPPEPTFTAEPSFVCSRGNEARYISMRRGEGAGEMACVVLNEGGAENLIDYRAQNDADFCKGKTTELANKYLAKQWTCAVGAL